MEMDKYRIAGKGSHSMNYIGPRNNRSKWFLTHPFPNTVSLPIPTFLEYLRFWVGYFILKDRWINYNNA